MNYSEKPGSCQVVFFKPSGKYYTTAAIDMTEFYHQKGGPIEALKTALRKYLGDRLSEMIAVCSEPYHEHAYPVMLMPGSW